MRSKSKHNLFSILLIFLFGDVYEILEIKNVVDDLSIEESVQENFIVFQKWIIDLWMWWISVFMLKFLDKCY